MIIQATEKPKGYFTKLPDHYLWFDLFDEHGTYAYVGIEIIDIWASFHTHIIRWSHCIAKSLKLDWEELVFLCKEKGVKIAVASNEDMNDTRWPKFIKLFGFPEPQTVLISKQEL